MGRGPRRGINVWPPFLLMVSTLAWTSSVLALILWSHSLVQTNFFPTFFLFRGNFKRGPIDVRGVMRQRRMPRSKKMYDLCFRSLRGLPLPARALTTLIIESIIGRLLCSEAIIICGYVWMSNHVHMQVFSLDCSALTHFHERLKKRLTDFLKRLLGLSQLNLWDNRTTLGEVLDLEAAIARVVYTYLNPVRAGLARSIDEYRGCNTWKHFISVPPDVNATIELQVPWILATDIEPLSQENPSLSEERHVISIAQEKASSREHNLVRIMPLKWLEAFKIVDPTEIEQIRERIIAQVRLEEARLARKKDSQVRIEGFVVTNDYVPRKKNRKVFMYASCKERRCRFLETFRMFVSQCMRCYLLMKQGYRDVPWPPGCFKPPLPRLCNAI
jgi:hypothetical protein